jgi:nitroimidazol reductase NimA-like FMN-containing flavoprotein (pyridoxamine 5'-phosphate oxidase superfamily)
MPEPAAMLPIDETTRVRREADLQVRERSVLHAILDEALVAHVAVVRDGKPLVLPFACARDGDALLLHGSTGSGLLRLAAEEPVCVAVTHLDGLVFARTTFESSMHYRSAVVHGVAETLSGDEKEEALRVLSDHLFPGRSAEVRASTSRELAATLVLRLPLASASVKVSDGPPEPGDEESDDVWSGVLPLQLVAGAPVAAAQVRPGVGVPQSVRRAASRGAAR